MKAGVRAGRRTAEASRAQDIRPVLLEHIRAAQKALCGMEAALIELVAGTKVLDLATPAEGLPLGEECGGWIAIHLRRDARAAIDALGTSTSHLHQALKHLEAVPAFSPLLPKGDST